jgi:hypothetical protein
VRSSSLGVLTIDWEAPGAVDIYGYAGSGQWKTVALKATGGHLAHADPDGIYYVYLRQSTQWGYSPWAESYVSDGP